MSEMEVVEIILQILLPIMSAVCGFYFGRAAESKRYRDLQYRHDRAIQFLESSNFSKAHEVIEILNRDFYV